MSDKPSLHQTVKGLTWDFNNIATCADGFIERTPFPLGGFVYSATRNDTMKEVYCGSSVLAACAALMGIPQKPTK